MNIVKNNPCNPSWGLWHRDPSTRVQEAQARKKQKEQEEADKKLAELQEFSIQCERKK